MRVWTFRHLAAAARSRVRAGAAAICIASALVSSLSAEGGRDARCDGLEALTLSGGRIHDQRGRAIGPGDAGTIEVRVMNTGPRPVNYPCVEFTADHAGVKFGADNPKATVYALAPGAATTFAAVVTVAASMRPGTVVRLTARLDVLHGGCTNGRSLAWTAVVR